ncbi:hypothetical protein [Posidoniimonas polymericola]|uniref:hypothetical protein n=1 Tax=Posidoniimonas polymericola TaxID=2528002 RepID=UPI0018D41D91|nr:hypothetical protein [Posidoniimonas polymericola]
MNRTLRPSTLACLLLGVAVVLLPDAAAETPSPAPRIVTIYNFIRNEDYRLRDSEEVLLGATRRQVELFGKHELPVTWALQYDALINPKYQQLLKQHAGPNDEIAAWWELPRPLIEAAGIAWRGDHDWVSTANIAFSPGYTPAERRKIADAYMAKFKEVFGYYPRSVGAWYIDEVTLAYLSEEYGIVASCNCKDQIGTDGYTLWGGYWNQAYYPSRLNAYMPAQHAGAQINVPVFRMLGSDPIYQYGRAPSITSLEPVYSHAGGSAKWVDWFLDALTTGPPLAFAYTQAGQENSFGWDAMGSGLEMQAERIAGLARSGKIRVETLAESGEWFRERFPVTPPTAFVCLDDWREEGRRSAWFNSRFYRVNLYWDRDRLSIRDLHLFDETRASTVHDKRLLENTLTCATLPIVEGRPPLAKNADPAGALPVAIDPAGAATPLLVDGPPAVTQRGDTRLAVEQRLAVGGTLKITCSEDRLVLIASGKSDQPRSWALDIVGQEQTPAEVTSSVIGFHSPSGNYRLELEPGSGTFERRADGGVRVLAGKEGQISLLLGDADE